jgi:hypothetical protein
MMISKKHSFIVLLVALLLGACSSKGSRGCGRLVTEGFSESDLIGTWDAMDSLMDSTIIIRGDSQYKQIIYVERTGFEYESDWKLWRVTYSDIGLPYLHLEGLLMCAYWRQIDCSTGKTGIEPIEVGDTKDPFADETYWYDFCQEEWVNTPGEGVFMVLGGLKYELDPREIRLVPFTKSPDGTSGPSYYLRAYYLREP